MNLENLRAAEYDSGNSLHLKLFRPSANTTFVTAPINPKFFSSQYMQILQTNLKRARVIEAHEIGNQGSEIRNLKWE